MARHVAAGRRPVLVYRLNMLGMECAAERFGLRHVKVSLQPCAIPSFDRPAWPLTGMARGRFRPLFRTLIIPGLFLVSETLRHYRRHTNRFRRAHGLAPHRPFQRHVSGADLHLLFAPAWFAMPQADWPANVRCVGFMFQDIAGNDPELEDFLSRHGPPLVFTPGTGVTGVDRQAAKAAAICAASGLPGLFLSPHVGMHPARPGFLVKGNADLGAVLPRARLLVHHGGIGTTAQALRAGIPQVILPDRFDQPDNAMRISELGLGAAVMDDGLDISGWVALAGHLAGNAAIAARLVRAAADIGRTDAAGMAAGLITDLTHRSPAACSRQDMNEDQEQPMESAVVDNEQQSWTTLSNTYPYWRMQLRCLTCTASTSYNQSIVLEGRFAWIDPLKEIFFSVIDH